jgi:hypothetical protein
MNIRRAFFVLSITSLIFISVLSLAGMVSAQDPMQTPEADQPIPTAQATATQAASPQADALQSEAASAQQQQAVPAAPTVENCPYIIRSGVPFVWLRNEPSIFGSVARTIYPGQGTFQLYQGLTQWDGTQWWVWATTSTGTSGNYYWVEFNSLVSQCVATQTPGGAASWTAGTTVRVRANVPFVWFRAAPAPGNQPIYTVLPGTALTIVQGAVIDTFNQYWWQVRDPRNGTTGWVEQFVLEQTSVVITPTPTSAPTQWQPGNVVRIRPNIAFSWLRPSPSSSSTIVYVAIPRQELIIQSGPVFDGVQNWWNVRVPNVAISGWVEANSLEYVRPQ